MRRVFIASPLRGDIERNQRYARAALRDSLDRGEAPFVPHLLYDQVLDDSVPEQRQQAINAALVMLEACDTLAVYINLGISSGMQGEIERAKALGIVNEVRTMPAPRLDPTRCPRCGWALVEDPRDGCVEGNCSLRPLPPLRRDGW